MALFAVASAKGSPGATVVASALAAVWPTPPILADLDPAGGDVAWRYRDGDGRPIDPQRGLLSLGAALRRGAAEADLEEHLQEVSGGLKVLAGLASPGQAVGLGPAWSQLARALTVPETDVFADCGRVGPGSPTMPVLTGADAVLLVVDPTIEGVAHLRDTIRLLGDQLRSGSLDGVPVGVAVVTSYRDGRAAEDLQQLFDADGVRATVLGIVADDPKAAAVMCGRSSASVTRSILLRSAAELADRLTTLANRRVEMMR